MTLAQTVSTGVSAVSAILYPPQCLNRMIYSTKTHNNHSWLVAFSPHKRELWVNKGIILKRPTSCVHTQVFLSHTTAVLMLTCLCGSVFVRVFVSTCCVVYLLESPFIFHDLDQWVLSWFSVFSTVCQANYDPLSGCIVSVHLTPTTLLSHWLTFY